MTNAAYKPIVELPELEATREDRERDRIAAYMDSQNWYAIGWDYPVLCEPTGTVHVTFSDSRKTIGFIRYEK